MRAMWLLVFFGWLSACNDAQPRLQPLSAESVILAFGDSLTFGTGTNAAQSYPAILQDLTGRTVVRAGVPGEVTAEGLNRLPAVLDEHQPQLVIICHGGNDLIRRKGKAQLVKNLRAMVQLAEATGADVLLVGVPEPSLLLSTADLYAQLANELEVPLESEAIADILSDRALKSDTIHPNATGYRHMAEAIAEVLEDHGAL